MVTEEAPVIFNGSPMTAYGTHAVVKRLKRKAATQGSKLILGVEDQVEKSLYCKLISKGKGRYNDRGLFEPSTLAEVNDIVLCRQFSGHKQPQYRIQNSKGSCATNSEYSIVNGVDIEAIRKPGPFKINGRHNFHLEMLLDYCIVERCKSEDKIGSIIIPELSVDPQMYGVVIAMGPGAHDQDGKYKHTEIQPGDYIFFSRWCGYELIIDGIEYMMCREFDLIKCALDMN